MIQFFNRLPTLNVPHTQSAPLGGAPPTALPFMRAAPVPAGGAATPYHVISHQLQARLQLAQVDVQSATAIADGAYRLAQSIGASAIVNHPNGIGFTTHHAAVPVPGIFRTTGLSPGISL